MVDKFIFEAIPVGTDEWQVRYRLDSKDYDPGEDYNAWSWLYEYSPNEDMRVKKFLSIGQAKHYARQWDEKRIRKARWAEQNPVEVWRSE